MTAPTSASRASRTSASRRGASSNGSGSTDSSAAARSPSPESVAPAPAAPQKILGVNGRYHKTLAEIFAGKVTPEAELFCPCDPFDEEHDVVVGVVSDQTAREFFSLQKSLQQDAARTPMPRNLGEVKAQKFAMAELVGLSKHANGLLWQAIGELFPESRHNGKLALKDGWRVVRPKTRKDRMREEWGAGGMPAEEISRRLARMKDEDEEEHDGDHQLSSLLRRRGGNPLEFLELLAAGLPGL